MKTTLTFLCCLFAGFNLFSQDLDQVKNADAKQIDAYTKAHQSLKNTHVLSSFNAASPEQLQIGLFKTTPLTLAPDISFYTGKGQAKEVNILAIAKAQERYKQSQIRDFKMPKRQLQQIRSSVQIMIERQSSAWDSTNDNLNFYGNNRSFDSGVKNSAYQETQRSTYTPYFGPYGWGGYSPYRYRPRGGVYFHRR